MLNSICPVCNKKASLNFLESYTDTEKEYKLYECDICGVQFWNPLKNPGSSWYEKDSRYSEINKNPDLNLGWNHKLALNSFKKIGGSVLDIGCGNGVFLYHAQRFGLKTFGIDLNINAINAAKDILKNDNFEQTDLVAFYNKNLNNKFDFITFFDVLEHIDNHGEFISLTKELLKSNGCVAATVPNREMARWLNPNDLPPRHLTRWSESSLRNFFEENGFKVYIVKKKMVTLSRLLMIMRFRFGKKISFGLVKKIRDRESSNNIPFLNYKIQAIHILAKIKDWFFWGIPALIIWFVLLFTPKKYVTLYVIAQKN